MLPISAQRLIVSALREEIAPRTSSGGNREPNDRILALEKRLDRLALCCQALWELLRDRDGLDDEAFLAKVSEVDLRDGQENGRMTPQQLACPSCGRLSNSRRHTCLFCGETLPREHVFE